MSNSEYPEIYTQLCAAIEDRKKETARQLILDNTEVNVNLRYNRNTPLHLAIFRFEDTEIIELLLDKNADVCALNDYDYTSLDVAVIMNKANVIKLLLNKGNFDENHLSSSIYEAIKYENEKIMLLLIHYAVQKNLPINLKSLLDLAITKGWPKIVEHLIPHCPFENSGDRMIPKNIVLNTKQQYRDCIDVLLKYDFIVNPRYIRNSDFVCSAVENGYTKIVKELLALGTNVNMVNKKTNCPLLHIACLKKHLEIAELLIKHNADVNTAIAENQWSQTDVEYSLYGENTILCGKTALYIAVNNLDVRMTKLLLNNGAKIQHSCKSPGTAVLKGCKEIVEILLEHGVNVDHADDSGNTLLHYCTIHDRLSPNNSAKRKIAELLLKKGANVNAQNQDGSTPIFNAVQNGYVDVAKILLNNNLDIQHADNYGYTLLHKASENSIYLSIIEFLLQCNVAVNVVSKSGLTPLHIACDNDQVKIVQVLLEHNADVNLADTDGNTPLHLACETKNIKTVESLLQKNAYVNAKGTDNNTPLHIACRKKCTNIMEVLLKHHADSNAQDKYGRTPLHIIITMLGSQTSSLEAIKLLLQHHADLNTVDSNRRTPLFNACDERNVDVIKFLLDNNAHVDHIDFQGKSPLYVAVEKPWTSIEIVKLLLKYNANVHLVNREKTSLLHHVVRNNRLDIFEQLIEMNININSANNNGETSLHFAAEKGHKKIVKCLLKHGADINILSKNRRTALHYANFGVTKLRKELRGYYRNRENGYFSREGSQDPEDENIIVCKQKIRTFQEVINILKEHIIKLKCAKLDVNPLNIDLAYDEDSDEASDEDDDASIVILDDFEYDCEYEIDEMKTEKIGDTNTTFWNLLTNNIHTIARYANNQSILESLESDLYSEKFSLYIDLIKNCFKDGVKRYKLMEIVWEYSFSSYLRLPLNCVDEIVSYLNTEELITFIEAIKPFINSNKSGPPSEEKRSTNNRPITPDKRSFKRQKISDDQL